MCPAQLNSWYLGQYWANTVMLSGNKINAILKKLYLNNTYVALNYLIPWWNQSFYIGVKNGVIWVSIFGFKIYQSPGQSSFWTGPSSPWIWKGLSTTLESGRYTLSYPRGRYSTFCNTAWWDKWNDTALQTQDSKFEPWPSTLLLGPHNTESWRVRGEKLFFSFECQRGRRTSDLPSFQASSFIHDTNKNASRRWIKLEMHVVLTKFDMSKLTF